MMRLQSRRAHLSSPTVIRSVSTQEGRRADRRAVDSRADRTEHTAPALHPAAQRLTSDAGTVVRAHGDSAGDGPRALVLANLQSHHAALLTDLRCTVASCGTSTNRMPSSSTMFSTVCCKLLIFGYHRTSVRHLLFGSRQLVNCEVPRVLAEPSTCLNQGMNVATLVRLVIAVALAIGEEAQPVLLGLRAMGYVWRVPAAEYRSQLLSGLRPG